jgi:hypothetical protein
MLKKTVHYDATSITQTLEWYMRFKSGQNSVQDFESSGRPPSSRTEENLEKLVEVIQEETRPTINDVCNILVLEYGECLPVLSGDINVRRIAAEFVTRLLNDDQNQNQMAVCKDLKVKGKNDIRFLYKFKADYNMEKVFKVTNIRGYSRG